MKVFVSGATGVLGRRAVVGLTRAGLAVTGVARSRRARVELANAGATPVAVDLFDAAAVRAAVAGHDVVVNLATSIPLGARAGELAAWEVNHRLRRDASRHLVDAALATAARRYVQESIALLYADGGGEVLDESAPVEATWITESALVAEAEAARFARGGGDGIALRFGQFYGPDSGHSVDARQAVLAGRPAELGPESAFRSSVTTDDAAAAVLAALAAPSGVYNVADDRALTRAQLVEALAAALGVTAPAMRSVDADLPPEFAMMGRSQRVSNVRFKEVTGWQPRFTNAREGWAYVAATWRDQAVGHAQ